MPRLFLLDALNLVYRAHYAFAGRPLRNAQGEPTSVLFGMVNTILKIRREQKPDYWALAWDGPGPTFRDALYPEYKATRPPMPDDISRQLGPLRELVAALGLPLAEAPAAEADDVMATLARRGEREGMEVGLVTSDKDMIPLVDDRVRLLVPQARGEDAVWLDAAGVRERWGVDPAQVRDVLALMGDSVDNVPGVRGVGEKTAKELIRQFGSLDELYRRLDEVKRPALRENLRAHRDDAYFSRTLVTVKEDLDLPWSWPALAVGPLDAAALLRFAERYGIHRLRRLAEEEGSAASARPAPPEPEPWDEPLPAPAPAVPARSEGQAPSAQLLLDWGERESVAPRDLHIVKPGTLAERCAALGAANGPVAMIAIAAEGEARGRVPLGLGVATPGAAAIYLPFDHEGFANLTRDEARSALAPWLAGSALVGHDVKSVLHALDALGIAPPGVDFDAMVASYVCDPSRDHSLEGVARDFAGLAPRPLAPPPTAKRAPRRQWPAELVAAHAADALQAVLAVIEPCRAQLDVSGQAPLFRDIELPLIPVLFAMERVGVALDAGVLDGMGREMEREIGRLEGELERLAGEPFNPNSPAQLQRVLFETLGLKGSKKTKTGYSTDQEVLEALAEEHELPRVLLEYRTLTKLKSTYVDALPALRDPADGRVHTTFNQTVASTGRLSSSNPNLQNIPMRTELGRKIRRAFVAPAGWALIGADYSQIELRVMAHLSGDTNLKEAFATGEDVHGRTARRVFGLGEGPVPPELRARAKIVNFGVMYGMGPRSLAQQMGIPRAEADAFIRDYGVVHAGVRAYLERTVRDARERGYTVTLMGRRCYLPALRSSDGFRRAMAERAAINAPIQGSAADLIKRAMIRIAASLRGAGHSARLLLQVHDELLIECPADEVDAVKARVKEEMEGVWPLDVPLVATLGVGENWLDVH